MLILSNAKIFTLNPEQPTAEAIAIQPIDDGSGRVLALGKTDSLLAEFGRATKIQNMAGRCIFPGLIDGHMHLRRYALGLDHVDVDTSTRAECLQRVAERAKESEPGEWIIGHGWKQQEWPEGHGNASLLDEVSPHNPVFLSAASLHAAWANSSALSIAGINENTVDPKNGRIQRDEAGHATGILFETAIPLVSKAIPQPSQAEIVKSIKGAQSKLWSMGLTGVHDFDRRRSFEALQTLHQNGELKLRVLKSLPIDSLEQATEIGLHSGFGDDMLRIGSIKVFADGALGPRTAAMLQAYEGEAENRGMLFYDSEELFEIGRKAALAGLSLAVHAIGDRANHEVLNSFEQLRNFEQQEGLPALRHRIEHVQLLHPDDFIRFNRFGITASVQPKFTTSDMFTAEKAWGGRSHHSYAWKRLLDLGARLSFGSDAPVESPNPFMGLHAAVTRRNAMGEPGEDGWHPSERLSFDGAMQAFTTGPAYLAGMESKQGKLAPGYLADLIVLDENPYEINNNELDGVKPTATMVGGNWVWQR
jgi:predicted amidohydrolase YtcJ